MKEIMSFLDLAEYILKTENKALDEKEIWSIAQQKIQAGEITYKTEGLTPWQTISAKIYSDIKNNPETTKFIKYIKPKRFILKDIANLSEQKLELNDNNNDVILKERNLHPYLALWLQKSQKEIYCKTIRHEETKKNKVKNGELKDHWLYPDMVGAQFIFNYTHQVQNFANHIRFPLVKITSYEIKLRITANNAKECYFQAVSNSSWANEGYLVTNEINGGDKLLDELTRLNKAFGIGVILLNINTPNTSVLDSEIILPAKEKEYIDMDTLNLLATKSQDVKKFIQSIDDCIKIKRVENTLFDKIDENLL